MKTYPIPHGWNCPKHCSNQMTVTTTNGTHHRAYCSICNTPLAGPSYWVPKPEGYDEPPMDTETGSLFDAESDPHADLKAKVESYRRYMR